MKASESQLAGIMTSFSMSGSAIVPQEEKTNGRIAMMPSTAIFF